MNDQSIIFFEKKNFANKLYVFIIIIIIHNLQFNQSNHHIYNSRPIHFFFVFCCQSKKRFKILKFFKIFNKILKLMMIDWIECNILFCFWWWKTTWKTSCFLREIFPCNKKIRFTSTKKSFPGKKEIFRKRNL